MSRDHRDDSEHEQGSERWLVSYADFITLMFAFFAILYATSEKDLEKSKEFQESIQKYLIKAGAFGESGQKIQQGDKHNTVIEPPITTYADKKPEAVAMLDKVEVFIESKITAKEKEAYVQDISVDDWGVRITLPAAALYANGSEKFKEPAMVFITKLGELLSESGRKILVEGHVRRGEKGNQRSTWDFASARAINFLRFVQAKQKIDLEKMVAASFADSRPVFSGPREALNSRLEIVVLNSDLDL